MKGKIIGIIFSLDDMLSVFLIWLIFNETGIFLLFVNCGAEKICENYKSIKKKQEKCTSVKMNLNRDGNIRKKIYNFILGKTTM